MISGNARRIRWHTHTTDFQEYIMDTRSNKFLALFSDSHILLPSFTPWQLKLSAQFIGHGMRK
jgi:hypothetical protein